MASTFEQAFADELAQVRAAGLWRELRRIEGPVDTWVNVDGIRALVLCSNNYLGLANHPALAAAAARAAVAYGGGAGASRLISGSLAIHRDLEARLARFKHAEAALLFPSGYHANVGAITTLVGRGDAVFSDQLNHASIIDGCRLSGAAVHVYAHADPAALDALLARAPARRRLVVTDSVFSMDGDHAPLAAICRIAAARGAMVMVDEAHATGVDGPSGAGLVEALGLGGAVTVQMGTLGKALGAAGAFVAGSRNLVDLLVNRARSFIYTTALPPPVAAAVDAALDIVAREPERRARLAQVATTLRARLSALGFTIPSGAGPIIPVMAGTSERALAWSRRLLERGVFVQAIRPPTVPEGTARLRVTVMATHSDADLAHAAAAFAALRDRA
ncbi:MAG: 8-amino-7-oxononanoate synthase [Polyangiaceae bacterium UTPRO1]|jgi:8-amino-7-oxononanoate synthase|nr:8-amino-7-oxononanoate synthase [Myxococcales bacterium]OQY68338.1 MAG: 8-amino-7-oxononanoate synthase [Polyangiaceae bacterium UTPRO1]